MYPPPSFETLEIQQMRKYVTMHAKLSNRTPTPFISATIDLVRALHIAFFTFRECTEVAILLICPSNLEPGSYIPCNELRVKCGLEAEHIYNTEVLVWGHIPSASILYRWDREQVYCSGLFDVFPCFTKLEATIRLEELRYKLKNDCSLFSIRKIASALVYLGMSPSELQTKQVFLFFLGRAVGYAVEKDLGRTEAHLRTSCAQQITEFEDAIFRLSSIVGRQSLLSYYQERYAKDVRQFCPHILGSTKYQRRWRKSWSMRVSDHFCPTFKSWWLRREKSYLNELKLEAMADHKAHGLMAYLVKYGICRRRHRRVSPRLFSAGP
jgi:hypothetical protein